MTVGIYKLVFKGTNKIYIGQSINVEKRLASHISHVKAGTCSEKIIKAFERYGIPELQLVIDCGIEELNDLETQAIDMFNSTREGFNTLDKGGDTPKPDNSGDKNGCSKLSNDSIVEIFNYLLDNPYSPLVDVSKILGVPYSIVGAIAKCENHKWLKEKYPEKYIILEGLVGRYNGKSAKARGIHYPDIVSPTGEIFNVENIRQFAITHKLDRGCLCNLLHSKQKSHKGWKLKM